MGRFTRVRNDSVGIGLLWGPTGNNHYQHGTVVRYLHGRRRPAIHVFPEASTASRGWCAFAHHDGARPAPRSSRFGYFPPDVTTSWPVPVALRLLPPGAGFGLRVTFDSTLAAGYESFSHSTAPKIIRHAGFGPAPVRYRSEPPGSHRRSPALRRDQPSHLARSDIALRIRHVFATGPGLR
jgi:hypothetical protein